MNEIREISVGVSVTGPVVVSVVIVDDQGAISIVEKRMSLELAKSLQRKLENAIVQAEEITKQAIQDSTDSTAIKQPIQPGSDIENELREAINDLGKSAILRGKSPVESNIHFMGAIRRLRGLREKLCLCYGGLCYEARETLDVADKLHRTLTGGN